MHIIVCERRVNVEDNGEESNDNGDSSSKTRIPIKAKSKEALNSCFKEKKWRNKQHYKEVDLPPKDFEEIFKKEREKKNPNRDETQLQIWEYLKKKQQKRLVPNIPRKQHCLEIAILQ